MHIKQQDNKIRHKVIMLISTKQHNIAITLQNNIIRYKTTLYKVIIFISTKQYIKTNTHCKIHTKQGYIITIQQNQTT